MCELDNGAQHEAISKASPPQTVEHMATVETRKEQGADCEEIPKASTVQKASPSLITEQNLDVTLKLDRM